MSGEVNYSEKIILLQNQLLQIQSGVDFKLLQDKAELSKDYKEIISDANGGIANQIYYLSIILTIVSIGLPIVTAIIGSYFKKQIEKIEASIVGKNKELNEKQDMLTNLISDAEVKQSLLSNSINNQDNRLYKLIRQHMIDEIIDRLIKVPEDRDHLRRDICVADKEFIKSRDHYEKLKSIKLSGNNDKMKKAILYQFFPYEAYKDNIFENREFRSHTMQYIQEIEYSTEEILKAYDEDKDKTKLKQYINELKKRLIIWQIDYNIDDILKQKNIIID